MKREYCKGQKCSAFTTFRMRRIWRAMKRKWYVSIICWSEYHITKKGLGSEFWFKVKNPTYYLKTLSTLKWHNFKGQFGGVLGLQESLTNPAWKPTSTLPHLRSTLPPVRFAISKSHRVSWLWSAFMSVQHAKDPVWCDVMDVAGWTTRAIDGLMMGCRMRWTSSNILYCPIPCGTLSACSAMDKDEDAGLQSCRYAFRRGLDSKSLILRRNTLSSGG